MDLPISIPLVRLAFLLAYYPPIKRSLRVVYKIHSLGNGPRMLPPGW